LGFIIIVLTIMKTETCFVVVVPDVSKRNRLVKDLPDSIHLFAIGSGGDFAEASLSCPSAQSADLVVVDLADPCSRDLTFWITLRAIYPAARVLAMVERPIDRNALLAAQQAGVYCFALWAEALEQWRKAARAARAGRRFYSASWLITEAQKLIREFAYLIIGMSLALTGCLLLPGASRGSVVAPTIEITRRVEARDATPTDMVCTALPGGMAVTISPVSFTSARVELSGLIPGEKLTIYFFQSYMQRTRQITVYPTEVADQDGDFTIQEDSLRPLPGVAINSWTVKVIHSRGVACAEVALP